MAIDPVHMDISIAMKNKGYIEIQGYDLTYDFLRKAPFFTKHPTKVNTWYFIHNNTGAWAYQKNKEWFQKYYPEVPELHRVDYTKQRESLEQNNLPGIVLDEYQEIAVDKMLTNQRYCIFMGAGSGKTIIALTYINSSSGTTFVVVTPKKVIGQYIAEGEKHVSDARFATIRDGKEFEPIEYDGKKVYVINYERMVKIPKTLQIDGLIFDESHYLKNTTSLANKTASKLSEQCNDIYMFTGTPTDENRHEIFAQLKIMCPQIVPTKTHFMNRYFLMNDYGKPIRELHSQELDEIIIKMVYGELTRNIVDLPPAIHYEIECVFKDKSIYDQMNKHSVVALDRNHNLTTLDKGTKIITAETPAVKEFKERQIASGYIYNNDEIIYLNDNPKQKPFLQLIPTLTNGIIFTRLKADGVIVTQLLDYLSRTYIVVDGSTKNSDDDINLFKNNQVDFLVIQLRSGNAGLHLVNTTSIVYYSLPESSLVYEQTMYRIRRRGQTNTCHYYSLVVKGTSEKKNLRRLKQKIEKTEDQFKLYRREE
jgi:SNF2 family DNA or RNA helicase